MFESGVFKVVASGDNLERSCVAGAVADSQRELRVPPPVLCAFTGMCALPGMCAFAGICAFAGMCALGGRV